jgi:hypothetical protein
VLRSRSRKELKLLAGARAGAAIKFRLLLQPPVRKRSPIPNFFYYENIIRINLFIGRSIILPNLYDFSRKKSYVSQLPVVAGAGAGFRAGAQTL